MVVGIIGWLEAENKLGSFRGLLLDLFRGVYGWRVIEGLLKISLRLFEFFWDCVQLNTSWWCHSYKKFFYHLPLSMIISDWLGNCK